MPVRSPARSPYLQPVQVDAPDAMIGRVVPVEITGVGPNSLFGRLMSPRRQRGFETDLTVRCRCAAILRPCLWRPNRPAQVTLAFDDNKHASVLFGLYDQNLAKVERKLGVVANALGNQVTIKGPPEACEQARASARKPL